MKSWRLALPGVLILAGVTALGGAVTSGQGQPKPAPVVATPAAPAAPAAGVPSGAPAAGSTSVGNPTELVIPKIGVYSTLIPLGLTPDGSAPQVPPTSTPGQAAWFSGGPRPGDVGAAVIVGHVDGDGQLGVFYHLGRLKAGDEIFVGRDNAPVARFRVAEVREVAKADFPARVVYGPVPGVELRLITCGGPFDDAAHQYLDSVVVFAHIE